MLQQQCGNAACPVRRSGIPSLHTYKTSVTKKNIFFHSTVAEEYVVQNLQKNNSHTIDIRRDGRGFSDHVFLYIYIHQVVVKGNIGICLARQFCIYIYIYRCFFTHGMTFLRDACEPSPYIYLLVGRLQRDTQHVPAATTRLASANLSVRTA